jgi:thiol-disulfide isomerase/thioredoxin
MRIRLTHTASIVAVIAIAVGIAGYAIFRPVAPPPRPEGQPATAIGKFTPVSPPLPAPGAAYRARDGAAKSLRDLAGHWVLVNLWATWCGPCIKEMPSLDRMQAKLGSALDVVAVSEDRNGAKAVDPFLAKLPVKNLTVGLDPTNALTAALHVEGLPTSLLIDPKGDIVAKLEGGAAWDQGPTLAKLQALMAAKR